MARVFDDFERAIGQKRMHQIVTLDWAEGVVPAAEDEGFSEVVSDRVLLVGAIAQGQ